MRAQHAMEAGFAGDIDALVGQGRDDARGRGLGEARLVRDLDDTRPFGLGQRVRRRWPRRVRPPVARTQTVAGLPALQGARVDAGQSTGGA